MPLVVVSSPKGGVGKTTVVANLSFAMTVLGYRVVTIDFDVQNALRLHYGMPVEDSRGFVADGLDRDDWSDLLLKSSSGVFFLPYGTVGAGPRQKFTRALIEGGPAYLARRLRNLLNRADCVVIADTPPGPGPVIDALDAIADFRILVLLTDAASLAQLPAIEAGNFFSDVHSPIRPIRLILNQVDLRRQLSRDVSDYLQSRVGSALLGTIRQDEAVAEAVAAQETVLEYAPNSGATADIQAIARRLDDSLFSAAALQRRSTGSA